ncbi:hypothetical protein [Chitinophaga sp. S165]|uniref:hypothetical protein n=1 Tax=Chitinophaga sp. S165 TaxID=2135462 RepID=UPI000D70F997|nr:hypothetical protein [Chitinophaga sp. S165]PWV51642.1 hypothetical protein C7475_103252 [Chitinophaga sp. S165]
METVISKKQETKTRKSVKHNCSLDRPVRRMTLKEALQDPFTKKKYEEAKATLARCPIPEEFLHRKNMKKVSNKSSK